MTDEANYVRVGDVPEQPTVTTYSACTECGRLRLAMQDAVTVIDKVPGETLALRTCRRILSEALEQETKE